MRRHFRGMSDSSDKELDAITLLSAGGRAVTFAGGGATESATAGVLNDDSATPHDCNGDGVIDAGDISATILAIFDPTFPGGPGCDSNGDGSVDAGDISCVIILIFGGTCGAGSSSTQVSLRETLPPFVMVRVADIQGQARAPTLLRGTVQAFDDQIHIAPRK